MATAAEVGAYVRRAFGDDDAIQIKDQDIVRWINAAQRNILIKHRVLKQVATTPLQVGVYEYDMSALPILQIQTIHYKGRPLEHRSFQSAEEYILEADPERIKQGTPIMWYSWGSTLYLWPTPNEGTFAGGPGIPFNVDSTGLKVFFLSKPTEVTGINSALTIPDEYFDRVVEFVLAQAYELDEDNQNSDYKLGQFREGLDEMAGDDRPNTDTYSIITVLPEDAW